MAIDSPNRWRHLGRIATTAIIAGVVAAVIAGGVAFGVSQSMPREYDSQAGVLVGSLTATSTDELDAYQRLALTYTELATSSPLLGRVISRLTLADDPLSLARRVDVRAPGQGIVLITATARSGEEAARIANIMADEIVILSKPVDPKIGNLATVFQPALLPSDPSSPRVLLNTLIAGLLGFTLGAAFGAFVATRRLTAEQTAG